MKKLLLLTLASVLCSVASFATLTPILGSPGVCAGSCTTLIDSTGGGTWSTSSTIIATIGSTGTVCGTFAGTVTITYTLGGAYVTMPFTVSPAPTGILGVANLCVGSTITVSDASAGGTWVSDAPWYASVDSITGVVTGVHAGVFDISYVTGPGCSVSHSDTAIGIPVPDSVYGASVVCIGSTITNYDLTPGGVWSSSNTTVASVNPTGIVTGVSAGTALISYTVTGICGTGYAPVNNVTVISSVVAGTVSGASSVSSGASITLVDLGGTTGGTWSSSNTTVANANSLTGVVTGLATGTATITYSVTGCGATVYATAMITVTPPNIISGNVNFTGASYTGSVKVWLITYDPLTKLLEAVDSSIVYSSGSSAYYEFGGQPTDSFRIKAAINDSSLLIGGTGYIPTYHTSDFYWYAATVLAHTGGTDAGQDINMLTGTITGGTGFIAGDVTTGANKGTASAIPAVGLQMYCTTATGAIIQQTVTDATGKYNFTNLPVGATYIVHPEAINYMSTDYTGITLTSSTPGMAGASFIQHTKSMTITPINTTVVDNITSATASVTAFPNPTSGKLNIKWADPTAEKATLTISDVTGREITRTSINMNEGSGNSQVDLSNLSNGLYMISIKSAAINYNNKIQVQK